MSHVWQAGRIGPLALPHRIVMGSMHLGLETQDPSGEAQAAFYRERAAGGAALIVTGGCAVSRVGAGGASYSLVNEDSEADALAKIPSAVHAEGGRVLLQLFHAGRYAYEKSFGLQPVAPSAVYSSYSRCEPRALDEEEIFSTIEDFARGAERARALGFDGVEIMGSEGYLLSQFMAPVTNVRNDGWGGDAERRMRFPLAVAAAVREACGPELAVVYRLSGADLVEGGAALEEVSALASRLASGPADAINVGIGWHESRVPTVQSGVPKGAWAPWARAVRAAVGGGVPVILSNRVNAAGLAGSLIERGYADFVSMARPFLADPRFVAHSREPAGGRVNTCIACNQCIDSSIFDRRVSCVVNPRAGYESEFPWAEAPHVLGSRSLKRAELSGEVGVRVAVVGGGPAGMEAARALAVAGFSVSLFEAADELGGQFRMARRIPGKGDFGLTGGYFAEELARLGVDVSVGVGVESVAALEGFDAVVVATGVVPRSVALAGAELPHVLTYSELLLSEYPYGLVGDRVAILGAGGIGTDIAHMLCGERDFYERHGLTPPSPPLTVMNGAENFVRATIVPPLPGAGPGSRRPRQVTLMRRSGRIGDGVGASTRWVVVQELRAAGVEMLTDVEYVRIEPDAVVIRAAVDGARGGERVERVERGERAERGERVERVERVERRILADTVVIAAGQEPRRELVDELVAAGKPHVVIGGASDASGLDAGRAFREGFEAPASVMQALRGADALTS